MDGCFQQQCGAETLKSRPVFKIPPRFWKRHGGGTFSLKKLLLLKLSEPVKYNIANGETAETLKTKIQELEGIAFVEAINKLSKK